MTGAAIVALVAMLGGQQNGGGGFGGGGFGGGTAGNANFVSPGDPLGFQRESGVTHILTPGDRGEWQIKARPGDVVAFEASSRVFDAALEIVDDKDIVVAKNDDIVEGVQTARVTFRIPDFRAYRCLVKGYKSAAGGEYSLKYKTFTPTTVALGVPLVVEPYTWIRLPANTTDDMAIYLSAGMLNMSITTCDENGTGRSLETAQNDTEATVAVFDKLSKGEHYVYLNFSGPKRKFIATPIVKKTAEIGSAPVKSTIPSGGIEEWVFTGSNKDTITIPKTRGFIDYSLERLLPRNSSDYFDDYRVISEIKSKQTVVFRGTTKYRLRAKNLLSVPIDHTISLPEVAIEWDKSKTLSDNLTLGESKVFHFKSVGKEMIQLVGKSSDFDIRIDLLSGSEPVESSDDNLDNFDSSILLPNTLPGLYTVVVRSVGNGGSGKFTLSTQPVSSKLIEGTAWQQGSVQTGMKELWSIPAKDKHAGILRIRSKDFMPVVQVFDVFGNNVTQLRQNPIDNEINIDLKNMEKGFYRVWVGSRELGGKYEIKWIDLDD